MTLVRDLNLAKRKELLERILDMFVVFCKQNFDFDLYPYQVRIARACLSSLFVEPKDVFIKLSRQSGKTEAVTLLVRFLIIFYLHFTGEPLMCGFASPKGEQAKTSVDRIKKSISLLRETWQVEDREFNAVTIRAYRFDKLHAEVFRFSLAPSTTNESKTLNLLIVDEAHKIDDEKRRDQLDPMLSSTGGVSWNIGVGCTTLCDFKRGCDGEIPDTEAIVVTVDEVIADRRIKFKETGDPKHLEYEKAFNRLIRQVGKENSEIRRNFYLEDTVEEGNFIARDRLLSCARSKLVCADKFFIGIDWAREADDTWATLVTPANDVVAWFQYPHIPYEDQIAMMVRDLEPYKGKIVGGLSDATGQGDAPTEYLLRNTWIPVEKFKFSMQSKNDLYTNFETALYRATDHEERFTYPADHPLSGKFEEQMTRLEREYLKDGAFLSVHHPEEPGARDDGPDSTALACFAARGGVIGDIVIL